MTHRPAVQSLPAGLLALCLLCAPAPTGCRCESPTPTQTAFVARPAGANGCPPPGNATVAGTVTQPSVVEASGLVVSRKNEGVLWVINDSGNAAELHAMSALGAEAGTWELVGAQNQDWEDLALGPGPEPAVDYLYVADTGTNTRARSRVVVYRLPEPPISRMATPYRHRAKVEALELDFPDGQVYDVEAILVDPRDGSLIAISKGRRGSSLVMRARVPLTAGRVAQLETIAELVLPDLGERGSNLVTAADISADGTYVLLRTYTTGYLWQRQDNEPLADAVARPPCQLALPPEQQGEAIALMPDARACYSLSEGLRQPLNRVAIELPGQPK